MDWAKGWLGKVAKSLGVRVGETADIEEMLKQAETLCDRGQYGEAIETFAQAVRRITAAHDERWHTLLIQAYCGLGRCQHALDNDEQAIVEFRKALRLCFSAREEGDSG